jgi:hypothetical protein
MLTMSLLVLVAAAGGWVVAAWSERSTPPNGRDPASGSTEEPVTRAFDPARLVARVDVLELEESSGIVASSIDPGTLWTHNDSGHAPSIYCVTYRGRPCGTVSLDGVEAYDWEDIARGPGPEPDTSYLYVADIGDNAQIRSEIELVRFPEPSRGDEVVLGAEVLTLTFPRGPRDAESAFIHPATGDAYVISKGAAPVLYVARSPLRTDAPNALERVARVPLPGLLPGPTGADISSDGRHLVLSTYGAAYEFEVTDSFKEAFVAGGIEIVLPIVMQREAIAYDLDGSRIFTTSEGAPMPLHVSEIRG